MEKPLKLDMTMTYVVPAVNGTVPVSSTMSMHRAAGSDGSNAPL